MIRTLHTPEVMFQKNPCGAAAFQVGRNLKLETVKYDHESHGNTGGE
jgi:hypothetical protein